MARYILIDRNSGYIWGDSADIAGKIFEGTPCELADALDQSLGEMPGLAEYHETSRTDANASYDVYRADVNGSEAVGVIQDGTDQEMIEAVTRDCKYVTTIARHIEVDR